MPEENNTPIVRLQDVSMFYKKCEALHKLTLDIPSHTLVGLIGPDGVGKSSLLSLITGAHKMTPYGNLLVLGGDMRDKSHRTRVCPKIAYMPQGLGKNLYFTLTVEENLQFFAKLFGHDAAECRRRIDRLTKSTGLYPFLNRPAGKLSGGMKQKLGLCCSLIHDPDLLVLDEPTTGVDPLARRQFWDLVDNVRLEQPQMGVIVATAYMDEAQRFDWLIAMDDGKILATGSPAELLERTGQDNLDAAFIRLLPKEKIQKHTDLTVPPLIVDESKEDYSIEASGLTRRFGKFTAVDHVSFKIHRGEIFGFLGSNGCGKTTTMRMLTGLLPVTEGEVKLFGKPIDANDLSVRLNLGYMTQLFSLYNELTVRQNLELFARLYQIPENIVNQRVQEMVDRFSLNAVENTTPTDLPLGIKQRLSLAAAAIHKPQILILDEPTSGVDPVARDTFWELIIELSRRDKVTIFITTHFMNEAARCDRISLMHSGKSLVCDTPDNIIHNRNAATLEEAFIGYLEDADPAANAAANAAQAANVQQEPEEHTSVPNSRNIVTDFIGRHFNWQRFFTCSWRETLEMQRDPIRLTLAIFGAIILMLVIGFGLNMDVEDLKFCVLDNDQSQMSVDYALNIAGSRYFSEQAPISSHAEIDKLLRAGKVALVVEIPAQFGRQLEQGFQPEVAVWVDASNPSRAETVNSYIEALHAQWLAQRNTAGGAKACLFSIETRNRYNPEVRSLPAMVPAVIPLLLLMIPAILSALSIVREKELGSITNLYVTPLSRGEFVLGKQMPYVVFSTISFILLIILAIFVFDVPVKGNMLALIVSLFLYCIVSTGMGLLASSVTKSQIAVIFLTMIATLMPAQQFCGLMNPVNTQQGLARIIGEIYPTSHALLICRGIFNKALSFNDLIKPMLSLVITIPVVLSIGILLQKKQEE